MSGQRRRRIAGNIWESHKRTIHRLYIEEDRKLDGEDGLINVMERVYHFEASKSQFELQLKRWQFKKYSTKRQWQTVSKILDERSAKGKSSDVFIHGVPLSRHKVRKEIARHRRNRTFDEDSIELLENLPEHIEIHSPPILSLTSTTNSDMDCLDTIFPEEQAASGSIAEEISDDNLSLVRRDTLPIQNSSQEGYATTQIDFVRTPQMNELDLRYQPLSPVDRNNPFEQFLGPL
ncbi:hypothetical protein CC78DRAFT_579384 [Lojkania enalia]|uniref:Clr5 domain-containing protein n=1 Tax=Lojkania enalia TaxID=147567 RepID=A0A9P4N4Y7_9PLEO|nr:hypothetical protein CC78DRAFT_579384 [Didymosphaeria enalia]